MTDEKHDAPGWQTELAASLKEFVSYVEGRRKAEQSESLWRLLRRCFLIGVALTFAVYWYVEFSRIAGETSSSASKGVAAVIGIEGMISSSSRASADNIVPLIEKACRAEVVKAIVLRIDSPGGVPGESERIVSAMRHCDDAGTHKPFYAVIDNLGASAAYMIAIHADKIFAGRYAMVGSVGAIIRYTDLSELASKWGVAEKTFKSGTLKGGPSMLGGTSAEDAKLNDELVAQIAKTFLSDVLEARKAKLKVDREALSSGRIWTASDALSLGLIDELAVIEDLKHGALKDLTFRTYVAPPNVAKLLNAESMAKSVLDAVATPRWQ